MWLLGSHVAAEPAATRYAIEAELDPEAGRVHGRLTLELTNHARAPLHELVLHLYANAFENDQTVFAREGGFGLRRLELTRPGSIRLDALETSAGDDLLARADHELLPGDRTQLRAPLPAPLAPGERLTVHARFEVALPSLVARMGQAGDFAMIAQWFPKLAKRMPDGTFRSTPYHGAGEFDADFADYDLVVRVPEDHAIAAPGDAAACPSEAARPGARCERYVLANALDVAWAASPRLELLRYQRPGSAIAIEVYAPRGARALAERQAELAAHALDALGELLGPYPHRRLVVVLPPGYALGAAGMEYPGLIVGWTASPWAMLAPALGPHDVVTAHEIAHQWFPMLVASDEVRNPVLDEGLSEWLGLHLMRELYGRALDWGVLGLTPARLTGLPLDGFDVAHALLARLEVPPSSWLRADQIALDQLGPAMYLRPSVVLEAIAREHGRPRLLRALGRYAREHRGRHVEPSDLLRALDAEYGAGFSARVLEPALAGQPAELGLRCHAARQAAIAGAFPARLLAWAQLAFAWIAP